MAFPEFPDVSRCHGHPGAATGMQDDDVMLVPDAVPGVDLHGAAGFRVVVWGLELLAVSGVPCAADALFSLIE